MTEEVDETQRICDDCELSKPLSSFVRNGETETICSRCRYSSITLGKPSDHPSRTMRDSKSQPQANSYNAGVPTDARGMPWLNADLSYVGQKQFDQQRHRIDQFERDRRQAPALPAQREVI